MGNFTDIYQEVKNLTCRPRDNLTFKQRVRETVSCTNAHIIGCSFHSWVLINDNCKDHK